MRPLSTTVLLDESSHYTDVTKIFRRTKHVEETPWLEHSLRDHYKRQLQLSDDPISVFNHIIFTEGLYLKNDKVFLEEVCRASDGQVQNSNHFPSDFFEYKDTDQNHINIGRGG